MPPIKYLANLTQTAEIGKKIYDERYRAQYEPAYNGKFLAIDLDTGVAALGETSSDAMAAGKQAVPGGFFYLIRVGFPAAFVHH